MKPTITVVAITSQKVDDHAWAIKNTSCLVPYETKQLLIAPEKPSDYIQYKGVHLTNDEWMPNGKWSITDLSRFYITKLNDYIDTDFCITVHWDGYALNKDCWDDCFLQYDYIGAPWPYWLLVIPWKTPNLFKRVGNGGFSLRSKKWLETSQKLGHLYKGEAEDVFCCRKYDYFFKEAGCKIAPLPVAMKWSYENPIINHPFWSMDNSFGFHGKKALSELKYIQSLT